MSGDSEKKARKKRKEIPETVSKSLQDIGKFFCNHRESLGLKHGAFAKRVGLQKKTVKELEESGKVNLKTLVMVLHALGIMESFDIFKVPDVARMPTGEAKDKIAKKKSRMDNTDKITLKPKRTIIKK